MTIFFSSVNFINSDVVCSEAELNRELREDIQDNGKLDCLRQSYNSDGTPIVGNAADWNSDCAFEAESTSNLFEFYILGGHWKTRLLRNYGLTKGLVDVEGNPVENDFEDQADMCEIIRALIANSKITFFIYYVDIFPNVDGDVTAINPEIVEKIDCPGDEGQTEVCAANPGSYADREGWYIFLDGQSINFNGKPKYQLSNK
jgi:hypothetical protein